MSEKSKVRWYSQVESKGNVGKRCLKIIHNFYLIPRVLIRRFCNWSMVAMARIAFYKEWSLNGHFWVYWNIFSHRLRPPFYIVFRSFKYGMKHECHYRIYFSIEPNTSTILAFSNFKTLSNNNLRLLSKLPVKHCGKVRVSKFLQFRTHSRTFSNIHYKETHQCMWKIISSVYLRK